MVGSKTSPGPPRASKKMLSRTPSDSPRPVLMMQQVLGDESPAAERRALVLTEVSDKMVVFGDAGPTRPKDMLEFTRNCKYKKVGGQQLERDCMFCGAHITSTGASRVVDHFAGQCVLCPPSVKDPCVAFRDSTDAKRKGKEEHTALVREEQEEAQLLRACNILE